jgi:hypothetical protein
MVSDPLGTYEIVVPGERQFVFPFPAGTRLPVAWVSAGERLRGKLLHGVRFRFRAAATPARPVTAELVVQNAPFLDLSGEIDADNALRACFVEEPRALAFGDAPVSFQLGYEHADLEHPQIHTWDDGSRDPVGIAEVPDIVLTISDDITGAGVGVAEQPLWRRETIDPARHVFTDNRHEVAPVDGRALVEALAAGHPFRARVKNFVVATGAAGGVWKYTMDLAATACAGKGLELYAFEPAGDPRPVTQIR